MCSIVVGIRGIPISSRIKRAPLPLWGLTPLLPPGKLSPSLSSAPDGLTSPLFPAASVSLFLFRSFPPPPFLLLFCFQPGYRNPPCLCFTRVLGTRDGAMLLSPIGFYTIHVRTIRFASGLPLVGKFSRASILSILGFSGKKNRNFRENRAFLGLEIGFSGKFRLEV